MRTWYLTQGLSGQWYVVQHGNKPKPGDIEVVEVSAADKHLKDAKFAMHVEWTKNNNAQGRIAELEHALNRIGILTHGELAYTAEFQDRVRQIIVEVLKGNKS